MELSSGVLENGSETLTGRLEKCKVGRTVTSIVTTSVR